MKKFRVKALRGRRQSGDTIVEVIIAIAVVSVVLVGAFVVTTTSQRAVRDSQEHAEALQQLQGQVELLRYYAARAGVLSSASLPSSFCLVSPPTTPPNNGYYNSSASLCQNVDGLYNLSITKSSVPTNLLTTTFLLYAKWPALGGGNDQVELTYQVVIT